MVGRDPGMFRFLMLCQVHSFTIMLNSECRQDKDTVMDVRTFEVTVMASVDECFTVTMEEGGGVKNQVRALKVAIAERTGMRRSQQVLFVLRDIIHDKGDDLPPPLPLVDDFVIEGACTVVVQWKYCDEVAFLWALVQSSPTLRTEWQDLRVDMSIEEVEKLHLKGVQIREGHIVCLCLDHVGDLSELPDLSVLEMLHDLIINAGPLERLPDLPKGLQSLLCCMTMLDQLPDLPKCLHTLICSYNGLQQLPDLPESLHTLQCECNQLQQLPDLPESLRTLHCESNQLQLLPALPEGLQELNFVDNPLRLNDNEIAELHRTYQSPWEKLM